MPYSRPFLGLVAKLAEGVSQEFRGQSRFLARDLGIGESPMPIKVNLHRSAELCPCRGQAVLDSNLTRRANMGHSLEAKPMLMNRVAEEEAEPL